MSYLSCLEQCVATLEDCNSNLSSTTSSLASLTQTFPRVAAVIRCEKKYDLTTASDIGKAQSLISKEAVPFLFRQVDQLESAIEAIRAAHETLSQRIEEQQTEFNQLAGDEASMGELQKSIKAEQSALSDVQANLLNAKSLLAAKERELAECQRTSSSIKERNAAMDEASKVDAEIIKVRRMIADIDHEAAGIPADDQLEDTDDSADKYLVLENLRELLAHCADSAADANIAAFIDSSASTLELLENKVFVPWWDGNSDIQNSRMSYITRLLRYFFKDHGAPMQAVVEILLEHQSMTMDDLRRELSATGHAYNELPALIARLKSIKAVATDTSTVAGKQIVTVQLDFSDLDDMDEPQQGYEQ
ncbi:hypothetical protein GQ54DRAFT_317876 [Martensiomyces pterosporus]|nr:hypothetical protein GQ54DRAFT_317876 [Martensiomyces pterosporus]